MSYIESMLTKNERPAKRALILDKITLSSVPSFDKNNSCGNKLTLLNI